MSAIACRPSDCIRCSSCTGRRRGLARRRRGDARPSPVRYRWRSQFYNQGPWRIRRWAVMDPMRGRRAIVSRRCSGVFRTSRHRRPRKNTGRGWDGNRRLTRSLVGVLVGCRKLPSTRSPFRHVRPGSCAQVQPRCLQSLECSALGSFPDVAYGERPPTVVRIHLSERSPGGAGPSLSGIWERRRVRSGFLPGEAWKMLREKEDIDLVSDMALSAIAVVV